MPESPRTLPGQEGDPVPAKGGFVEFVALEAGHNHQMSLAEKEAHGAPEVS